MSFIRVLIADDHAVVRDGLKLVLEAEDGFAVVGEAGDGAEAVRLARELAPDVVLMDLRMPGLDGLRALEEIHRDAPNIAVVILTTYNEDDLMARGLRAGARGYLLKDTNRRTLYETLRAAARGDTLLQPEILQRVLHTGRAEKNERDRGSPWHHGTNGKSPPGKYLQQTRRGLARRGDCSSIETGLAERLKLF
jgi:DNA-binding NarL/FixJ family response regulator